MWNPPGDAQGQLDVCVTVVCEMALPFGGNGREARLTMSRARGGSGMHSVPLTLSD